MTNLVVLAIFMLSFPAVFIAIPLVVEGIIIKRKG